MIEVSLEKLLGYAFTDGTLRIRDYEILGLDKGLRRVQITLNDQKGIEDNSGTW